MAKMGAPYGERHGKGKKYSDALVQECVSRWEAGESPKALAEEKGVNINTLFDWLKGYTRYRVC